MAGKTAPPIKEAISGIVPLNAIAKDISKLRNHLLSMTLYPTYILSQPIPKRALPY
jgi:hypothetical protein